MAGRECFHCKSWVEEGEPHDCWTTTPAALTRDLPEHLREAWERLRETALEFGEQRTYASHNSIMFSRRACYFFVRPKKSALEICVFLGRTVTAPQIRRAVPASRRKVAHLIHVRHRDEVEAPITDWLQEAYESSDALGGRRTAKPAQAPTPKPLATRKSAVRRARRPGTTSTAKKRSKRAPRARARR
jgi:hypothetical protein